jgi:hypothetical protein
LIAGAGAAAVDRIPHAGRADATTGVVEGKDGPRSPR